jgi:hypothetical protein
MMILLGLENSDMLSLQPYQRRMTSNALLGRFYLENDGAPLLAVASVATCLEPLALVIEGPEDLVFSDRLSPRT